MYVFLCFIFVLSFLVPIFMHCWRLMSNNKDLRTYLLMSNGLFALWTQRENQAPGRGPAATENKPTTWIWKTLSSSDCMQGEMFLPCCVTTGKIHILQLFVCVNISSCSKITSCYSLQKKLYICSEYVLNEILCISMQLFNW